MITIVLVGSNGLSFSHGGASCADEAQFAGFFGSNVANLGSGLPDASRTPAMTDFLADELGGDDTEDSGFGAGFGGGFGME